MDKSYILKIHWKFAEIPPLCIRGEGYCVLSSEKDISMTLLEWSAAAPLASLAALALEGVASWRRLLARVEPTPGVRVRIVREGCPKVKHLLSIRSC